MKTDVLHAPNGVTIDAAITLDGFIVKETLAKDALLPKTTSPAKKRVFTAADLWNIQKNGRKH
jgi:hypothetical protein